MISETHMSSVLVQCKEKRNRVFPLLPVLKQYSCKILLLTEYHHVSSMSCPFSGPIHYRASIRSREPGISPGYYECGPLLLSLENKRKLEPKEIPSCLIPHLLVVFTRKLETLVTTLYLYFI